MARIEFKLPEETRDLEEMLAASRILSAIQTFDNELRALSKSDADPLTPQDVRDRLRECFVSDADLELVFGG